MSQPDEAKASSELECVHKQEAIEIWKSWLPKGARATLFSLVMLVCLIIGIIHFFRTSDISMLTLLLVYASAYAGLPEVKASLTEVKTLFPSRQKMEKDTPSQQN